VEKLMGNFIRKSESVDVMIIGEGTYPYIRGGVSSWIHQLLLGLPEISFGIIFLGSRKEDYGEICYELPINLLHLEVHYLFDDTKPLPSKREGSAEAMTIIQSLYKQFKDKNNAFPAPMQNIEFFTKKMPYEDFLYAHKTWEFIEEKYKKNCPDISFIDYFWTLRNMHKPIWTLADIVATMPKAKVLHSPSTGYAGFLATLASYDRRLPFLLTEHGIYTRERKIDMLTADWVDFKKPTLLKQPEEANYIKTMWVKFFERIGEFAYARADSVLSLYSGARDIQVRFGAPIEKTRVIPNAVDVEGLGALVQKREEGIPPIVTLIGRVVSIKDIKTFIRAMRITITAIPQAQGWIVGPMNEDKVYAQECENMTESLGIKDNIKFLGFQNIKDILPKSGLLTLTSISEGMPLVILEGFAAGVPCVATDVGSCYDLIKGGIDEDDIALGSAGEVTGIANPSALAAEYVRYLSDASLWKSAQKSALARVDKYYRQETFLDAYRDLYMKAMENGRDRV
jgi:glycosyltransferase involved in cell wall biosynthesis